MENKLTLTELISVANGRLEGEGLRPYSISSLRHYSSNHLLPKPTKEGREARYGDAHVEAMLSLRRSQKIGVSARAHTTAIHYANHTAAEPHTPILQSITADLVPTNDAAQQRKAALGFLSGLNNSFTSKTASSKSHTISSSQSYGSTGALANHAQTSGLLGLVSSNAHLQLPDISSHPSGLGWHEYELHPGVRLSLRTTLAPISSEERSAVLDRINQILIIDSKGKK